MSEIDPMLRLEADHQRARSRREDPSQARRGDSDPRRVHAKARFVWIRPGPSPGDGWLGYLTLGQSIGVREDARGDVPGDGASCESWVPVEPRGWVCVGRDATFDPRDPVFEILERFKPDVTSPWPFEYARSLGTPRYWTLPTESDQRAKEGDVKARMERVRRARDATTADAIAKIDRSLVGVDLEAAGRPPPPDLAPTFSILEGHEDIPLGSTIAYPYTFDHGGRTWLLSWDHAIVPATRVARYPRSELAGVPLGAGLDLPVAFFRHEPRPKYRIGSDGRMTTTGETWTPRTFVGVTEARVAQGGRHYVATTEPGIFADSADVTVIPRGASVPRGVPDEGRRTWIDVSTLGGWLVAYSGETAVYATLISAGRAAMRPDGRGMIDASSTPPGLYPILTKLRTATMRSENRPDAMHAEVMYTQVFFEEYALHGAYWHDDFGDRKSAGCVNLSPIDAKWLFDWSEPSVPDDWHAKRTLPGEPTTIVRVQL